MTALDAVKADFIAALGEKPLITIDDIAAMLAKADGRAHLWCGERSALFTRIEDYDHARVICAGPASGDLQEILNGVPKIEELARAAGCTQAHVWAGRQGWTRALRDQGYDHYATVLRKLL